LNCSAKRVNSDPTNRPSWLRIIIMGRNPRFTLVRAVCLAAAAFVIFRFILLPIRVTGGSMEPTYHDGRINFINQLAYHRHEPRRGDVVGVRFAGPSRMLLKRVVGLPGELIGFQNGRVTVNGEALDEPYLKFRSDWARYPVQVGPDEYFVVGDNRSMPIENHMFGIAKRERIIGKTLL
jgi:signal peptidase I